MAVQDYLEYSSTGICQWDDDARMNSFKVEVNIPNHSGP